MREVNTHKIIRIFLASSIDDTKEERDKLQNKILAVWNPIFNKFNIELKIFRCEQMTEEWLKRNQKTIDDEIRNSDVFIVIFKNTVGNYTFHEFEVARDCYSKTNGKPRIYPYISNELIKNIDKIPALQEITRDDNYPETFTSRQEKLLRDAFVGREWVDAAVSRWLQDDSTPRICLLTGAPGVGKSAYAAHFTHYNGSVAAALFCSSEMNTFNDPRTVIQTLAYLMACRLPAYRQSLMLHLPEDRAAVERLSEKELFEQLISKPLSLSIDGHHERMVILLDGLDECGSPEQNVLAKTLDEFAPSLPDWLRILLVARDIPAISVYTKGAYRIEIGSESENNLKDIRAYYRFELESKFGDDPHWDDALERMTARSQGIFLYAQMLTDLLRSRGTLGATEEYPDGLDAVFTRWFSWFFNDSDFRSFWRPAISCILGAPAPLPAETLRRVMHWGENELADFRARLKVLLRVEKNEFDEETLVFDHAFVREWLTRGAGENVYFCSPKDGAEKLAAELFSIFERGPEELSFWEAVHLMDLPMMKNHREKAMESLALDVRVREAGDYCETWGKYDKAEEIYEKALTFAEERDRKLANEDSQRIIAYYLKRNSLNWNTSRYSCCHSRSCCRRSSGG